MSALKRGAKGKPVEALQTRLNKLGAKPKLKVDGIFGPITHKAVVAFQKSAKLKSADGEVGKYTEAALKVGGPLPEMNTPDFSKAPQIAKDLQKHNQLLLGHMMALDGATGIVDKILAKKLPAATKMVSNNMPLWDEIIKKATELSKMQKDFKAIRLSDPIRATKLTEDCEDLHDKILESGDKMGANVDTVYDTLDQTVKDLSKGVADIEKMMANVKKHVRKGTKLY